MRKLIRVYSIYELLILFAGKADDPFFFLFQNKINNSRYLINFIDQKRRVFLGKLIEGLLIGTCWVQKAIWLFNIHIS